MVQKSQMHRFFRLIQKIEIKMLRGILKKLNLLMHLQSILSASREVNLGTYLLLFRLFFL